MNARPSRNAAAPTTDDSARSVFLTAALCLSVMIAGACVMLLELMGTRVLAPVFGSSLYVWTSQISVALLALTIGYPLGGAIADRHPRAAVFFGINALAGLAILFMMFIRGSVLHAASDWGPRVGTLGSSLILFTVPLVLLGMVGPFAARLFVHEVGRVGFTVGKLSGLSAFGSIVGSIATGFVLIPRFAINDTFFAAAALMVLVGVVGLLVTRALNGAAGTMVAAAGLTLIVLSTDARAELDDVLESRGIEVLYEGSSGYGDIKVVQTQTVRLMYIGQMVQTVDSPLAVDDLQRHVVTLHDITHFLRALRPEMKDVLLIGLAGGNKVKLLNRYDIAVDAVEIDGLVVQKAREFFGIEENDLTRIIIEDGRPYMNRCKKKYDAVIMDVFSGGVAPSHLFSLEALQSMKRCLKPDGVLMMNCLWSPNEPDDFLLKNVTRTIESSGLFNHRRLFAWRPSDSSRIGNFFTFASEAPLEFVRPLASIIPAKLAEDLASAAVETEISLEGAAVITDDRNPLDVLQIRHSEKLRRIALDSPAAVLFDPRR
ncbi:MAG: fused MFS/spermidine synthase [Phycisphaerae bacterium]